MLLLCLIVPLCAAMTKVDITLNRNDLAREDFTIAIDSESGFDYFDFQAARPISIIYDGSYELTDSGIRFEKSIIPGENILKFSLLYDDLVESKGNLHIFRTSIISDDRINMRLHLPEMTTLSDAPGAIPTPSEVSTDGKRIILGWEFGEEATVAVFYESEKDNTLFIAAGALFAILISAYVFYRLSHKRVLEILTKDEQDVLALIKKKVVKQSEVSQRLGFSKSKMSKLIRKLEEKNLIRKEPYFKTNILKIR